MTDEALLILRGLHGGYDAETILQGVDMEVEKGEIVAVIGRNGVGKTTLMRTLSGLLRPSAGTIRFAGRDVTGDSANMRARAGIGYIPQGRDVFPELTVRENLTVGEVAGRGRTRPDYQLVYKFFPILEERARQRAGTLSGGQQQQLAIGRAMMSKPTLMLLDEPSEGIQRQGYRPQRADTERTDEHGRAARRAKSRSDRFDRTTRLRHGEGPPGIAARPGRDHIARRSAQTSDNLDR